MSKMRVTVTIKQLSAGTEHTPEETCALKFIAQLEVLHQLSLKLVKPFSQAYLDLIVKHHTDHYNSARSLTYWGYKLESVKHVDELLNVASQDELKLKLGKIKLVIKDT